MVVAAYCICAFIYISIFTWDFLLFASLMSSLAQVNPIIPHDRRASPYFGVCLFFFRRLSTTVHRLVSTTLNQTVQWRVYRGTYCGRFVGVNRMVAVKKFIAIYTSGRAYIVMTTTSRWRRAFDVNLFFFDRCSYCCCGLFKVL